MCPLGSLSSPAPRPLDRKLSGWGRSIVEPASVYQPETIAELEAVVLAAGERNVISRGFGCSYGDSAQNASGAVSEQTRLDRFIAFDTKTGLLDTETGVSLASIIDTFLPRGWFPPVVPGTKSVSVGGAIASDVHGKNHHRIGSFSRFVERIEVLLPSGETVLASKEERPELFWATVGGMGLTGVITRAQIRMKRIASSWFRVQYRRTSDLRSTISELLDGAQTFD
jgi:decaprenylphospho-beta-D-ribofuranose 2-oxidase